MHECPQTHNPQTHKPTNPHYDSVLFYSNKFNDRCHTTKLYVNQVIALYVELDKPFYPN